MKVLITGGAGYIGTALTMSLAQNEEIEHILVYDNLSRNNRNFFIGKDKLPASKVQFVQGDILDSRLLRKTLKGIDVVFHLAANVTTPFADQNPHLFEQVNHWGTAELVYAIEESEVKQLVYLSSVSVYGAGKSMMQIGDALNPRTFYGISKMRGEEHVSRLSNKLDTYIIRCGNVYGYNKSMRFDAVINRFLFEANFNGRITVNGTGEQQRPFIHIDKVAKVLEAIITEEQNPGTYHLVERNMAIGEVVQTLRELFPDLEMLFVNQHMKLRELSISPDAQMNRYFSDLNKSFKEELEDFRKAFVY